jgi:hypothetical protein
MDAAGDAAGRVSTTELECLLSLRSLKTPLREYLLTLVDQHWPTGPSL